MISPPTRSGTPDPPVPTWADLGPAGLRPDVDGRVDRPAAQALALELAWATGLSPDACGVLVTAVLHALPVRLWLGPQPTGRRARRAEPAIVLLTGLADTRTDHPNLGLRTWTGTRLVALGEVARIEAAA